MFGPPLNPPPTRVSDFPLTWTVPGQCDGYPRSTDFPQWPRDYSTALYAQPPFSAPATQLDQGFPRNCNNVAGNGQIFIENHGDSMKGGAAVGFQVTAPPPGLWNQMAISTDFVFQYYSHVHGTAPLVSHSSYGQVSLYVQDVTANYVGVYKTDFPIYHVWLQNPGGGGDQGTSTSGYWMTVANTNGAFAAQPNHTYNVWVWAENYNNGDDLCGNFCNNDMMAVTVYDVDYNFTAL